MEKGINLQIDEFKQNLAMVINESHMPPSIVEMVLQGLLSEASMINRQQLLRETQEYAENSNKAE